MPRLLLFAPCENVLISEGNASLITLMHELTIQAPQDIPDPIPENVAIPHRWFIYSQWEVLPGDPGIEFEERFSLSNDGGRPPLEGIVSFTPEPDKIIHRVTMKLGHFPVTPSGDYRLRLFLRRVGTEEWQEHANYPFRVTIQRHGNVHQQR